jgi:hypothetical protein
MLSSLRRFLVVGGIIAAVAAPAALLAGPAGAAQSGQAAAATAARPAAPACIPNPYTGVCNSPTVTGYGEAPAGLNIRQGPGTGYPVAGAIPDGDSVTTWCWHVGTDVNGDSFWDFVTGPYGTGYVSDYWLYTGGNIDQQLYSCIDGLN